MTGGLGAAIAEVLAETTPRRLHRVGLRDFGESGSPEDLYAKYHIDGPGIYLEAKQALER